MYQNLENNLHDPHDSQNFFDFLWVPTCIYCTIYGSTEKEHFLENCWICFDLSSVWQAKLNGSTGCPVLGVCSSSNPIVHLF